MKKKNSRTKKSKSSRQKNKVKGQNLVFSTVEAIVRDDKNRVLLLKRSKNNKFFIGKWQLPGGKVEFGENVDKAIKREILEETGGYCSDLKSEKVLSFTMEFEHSSATIFLMVFSGKIKDPICLSSEHSKFKFVSLSSIKKSALAPMSARALFD